MLKSTAKNIVMSGVLMLLVPLFALVYSLKGKYGQNYKKWMLTIFATIYASMFGMDNIGDGTRHWQRVYDYYVELSFSQWLNDFWDIITFTTNHDVNEDVYIHVLSFFTGSILSAPGLFFVFVGFIYGYFFSASVVKLFDKFPSFKKHTGFFILACYFIAILNLQSMNTVRTWTGFWVLFYGVMQYHDTKKLKYLLLVLSAPLFHVAYFVMAIPAWLILFFPVKRILLVALYFVSFATTLVNPQAALKSIEQVELGQEKADAYYIESKSTLSDRLESQNKLGNRWYRTYYKSGLTSLAMVGITLVFILNKTFLNKMKSLEATLFSIGLLTKVLSNSTWFLYALTNRTDVISSLFILAGILVFWQRHYKTTTKHSIKFSLRLKMLWIPSLALIVPVFFYHIANTLVYLSFFILGLPMLAWMDDSLRITLRMAIGWLLGIG